MRSMAILSRRLAAVALVVGGLLGGRLPAEDKTILLDELPPGLETFTVTPKGDRLYFGAGHEFYVFDATGRLLDKYLAPTAVRKLFPLPDGTFIASLWQADGQLALYRADGTFLRTLVKRGRDRGELRADTTGGSSPGAVAVDTRTQRLFALDVTAAPHDQRALPDPDWSRIAIFDFSGKFLHALNAYSAYAADAAANDAKRTWYTDLALDLERQRVYATARASNEVLALNYGGQEVGRVPSDPGYLAVFPDGRFAVAWGATIKLYNPDLQPIGKLAPPPEAAGIEFRDLETDEAGRLYAATNHPGFLFLRWTPDLQSVTVCGPRYQRLRVDWPEPAVVTAGQETRIKVGIAGRPAPAPAGPWQVLARPTDGTDLLWRALPAKLADGALQVAVPADWQGLYDVAVRYGAGLPTPGDRPHDPCLQHTFAVVPAGATQSLAAFTSTGRRAFRQGEPILLALARRADRPAATPVRLTLEAGAATLLAADVTVTTQLALTIPGDVTRGLLPGEYLLRPAAAAHHSYPLRLTIAADRPGSSIQRILYQEGDAPLATAANPLLTDPPEALAGVRDYARTAAALGFTRETDRLGQAFADPRAPLTWCRDTTPPAALQAPGLAPAEYYADPPPAGWQAEYYLDQAVAHGLNWDTQLLGHDAGARFRDWHLQRLVLGLQRLVQWGERYPSFYGVNYHGNLSFGPPDPQWAPEDDEWLKQAQTGKFKDRRRPDVLRYALRTMYDAFNNGVRTVRPETRLTTTPPWPALALEGHYAPEIYQSLSETYTHFPALGYRYPWATAAAAEFLRRPGLPLLAVGDSSADAPAGDLYLKQVMQALASGVQGVGVQQRTPFQDAASGAAYRVGNLLAAMYGPLLAAAPPVVEGAVLYSYAQDSRGKLGHLGTAHFDRVYALLGAGLMAGLPLRVVYEEDVAAGALLDGGQPRVPRLFFAGQTRRLPAPVVAAVKAYAAAGGKVFLDETGEDEKSGVTDLNPTLLNLKTSALREALSEAAAADSLWLRCQPVFEQLAKDLRQAFEKDVRFPVRTDELWLAKSVFDGGAIQYVMLAREAAPYPWDPGTLWSLGGGYALGGSAWLPTQTTLYLPHVTPAVYDVFDQRLLGADLSKVDVDLRHFPGRLYAVASLPIGAPSLDATRRDGDLACRVVMRNVRGTVLPARVPLRLRLLAGARVAGEFFRVSDATGALTETLPLPFGTGPLTLEVTELVGGQAAALEVAPPPPPAALTVPRPDVEFFHEDRIRTLLAAAGDRGLNLVTANTQVLPVAQRDALRAACKAVKIEFTADGSGVKELKPGICLAVGCVAGLPGQTDPAAVAWAKGLYPVAVSALEPGPGRGLITAVFTPRGPGEHAIVLLGGDAEGLGKAVAAFAAWLAKPATPAPPTPAPPAPAKYDLAGKSGKAPPVPRLSELTGARLSGVVPGADGRSLVVTADGYQRNLALVEDGGAGGRVLASLRVGQAPQVGSAFVTPDGRYFGAAARTAGRLGETLHLVAATDRRLELFPVFGDYGRTARQFGISRDGSAVLIPGTYGVVCLRRQGQQWQEAWALDYWREFPKLDWPLGATGERRPQFDVVMADGTNLAVILFSEIPPHCAVAPDSPSRAEAKAVDAISGRVVWSFPVPVTKTLLRPRVTAAGSHALLEVTLGGAGRETCRYYLLRDGKLAGQWDLDHGRTTVARALAPTTGRCVLAGEDRSLEARQGDGTLAYHRLWPCQPLDVALAGDGASLFVTDNLGQLARLDPDGKVVWSVALGTVGHLGVRGDRVYVAGWDGRLRAFRDTGAAVWSLDLTAALAEAAPAEALKSSARRAGTPLWSAKRAPTTTKDVPPGPDLLKAGKATLTVGGTPGPESAGTVLVAAADLIGAQTTETDTPWLALDELFWAATTGRQVWAEIEFKEPTDVGSLTVYEHHGHPEAWTTEGLVQAWNAATSRWETAAYGVFLNAPVNTYQLNLRKTKKIRYVPMNDYFTNFHITKIEVRALK